MAWAQLRPPRAVPLDPQAGCNLNRDSCRERPRWCVTVIAHSGREVYSVPSGFKTRPTPS